MSHAIDPAHLTAALIRRPSVTPADEGALDVLSAALESLGFTCTRLPFSEEGTPDVDNLYARLGTEAPHFCFAGHTDVVPPGPAEDWRSDPFEAAEDGGYIIGRGAVDMKGAIAAFAAAVSRFIDEGEFKGSISFLITGDEEGPAINGTKKMLTWLEEQGEVIDHCLVGEPTNVAELGDMMKIGRRASLTAWVEVEGVQGHVAYPDRAKNPVPCLIEILRRLASRELDQGTEHFQPSNLEITDVHTGNEARNVIPGKATGRINIRFNSEQRADDLRAWIAEISREVGGVYACDVKVSFAGAGDAFYFEPSAFTEMVAGSIEEVTGRRPEYSTGGGTSDARFIKDVCPVAEFGLVGQTMHKVDERVAIADLTALTEIYQRVLARYFSAA